MELDFDLPAPDFDAEPDTRPEVTRGGQTTLPSGAVVNPQGQGVLGTEDIQRALTTAQSNYEKILAQPNLPQHIRDDVETELEGVNRSLAGGQQDEEDTKFAGSLAGKIGRGALNLAQITASPLAIGANETVDVVSALFNPDEDVSRELRDIPSSFADGIALGFGDRRTPVTFGDVAQNLFGDRGNELSLGDIAGIGDIPFVGTRVLEAVTLNRGVGLFGDTAFDALNLVGGGVLKTSFKTGLKAPAIFRTLTKSADELAAEGAEATIKSQAKRGASKAQIANAILEAAPNGTRSFEDLGDIAAKVRINGPGALNATERAQITDIYQYGISIRKPTIWRKGERLSEPVVIFDNAAVQRFGSRINPGSRITKRIDARRERRETLPKWFLGGLSNNVQRQAARKGGTEFRTAVASVRQDRLANAAQGVLKDRLTREAFETLVEDGDLPGNAVRGLSRREGQKAADQITERLSRATDEFFRAADEGGTGIVDGISLDAWASLQASYRKQLLEAGLDVGLVDNYIPRLLDDIGEALKKSDGVNLGSASSRKEFFENHRTFAKGEKYLGVRLQRGTVNELEEIFIDKYGENAVFSANFLTDPAAILDSQTTAISRALSTQNSLLKTAERGLAGRAATLRVVERLKPHILEQLGKGGDEAEEALSKALEEGWVSNIIGFDKLGAAIRRWWEEDSFYDPVAKRMVDRGKGTVKDADGQVTHRSWTGSALRPHPYRRELLNMPEEMADAARMNPQWGLSKVDAQVVNDLDEVDIMHFLSDPRRVQARMAQLSDEARLDPTSPFGKEAAERFDAAHDLLELADNIADESTALYYRVLAQESATRGMLSRYGADLSDAGIVRTAQRAAEDPAQIQAMQGLISRNINEIMGEEMAIAGQGFVVDDDFLNIFRARAEVSKQLPRWLEEISKVTQWLKAQQTSTISFNVRNFYSGQFAEHLAGHNVEDFQTFVSLRNKYFADPDSVPDDVRQIMGEIYESGLVSQRQSRLSEEIGIDPADRFGRVDPDTNIGIRSLNRIQNFAQNTGERFDTAVASTIATAAAPIAARGKAPAANIEELLRGSHIFTEMTKFGRSFDDSVDNMLKYHFDYGDLTRTERVTKIGVPYWTFMSRNLPLMLEMVAKKPAAFNHLWAWQQELDDRYRDPILTPGYYDSFLHFLGPGNGGDPQRPFAAQIDFQVNDLQEILGDVREGYADGQVFGALGGAFRGVLNDTAPWFKAPVEWGLQLNTFTDAPLTGTQHPVWDPALPTVGPTPEGNPTAGQGVFNTALDFLPEPVLDFLENSQLGFVQIARNEQDQRVVQVDKGFNHFVGQQIPWLYRLQRMFPADPDMQDRATAAWVGFVFGRFADVSPREARTSAISKGFESSELVQKLKDQGYIEDTGSNTTSRSGRTIGG